MSDEDELYTKVVVLDEIYNSVVQNFFDLRSLWCQNIHHKIFIELIPKKSICSIAVAELEEDVRRGQ
jgi:hypothetical protein